MLASVWPNSFPPPLNINSIYVMLVTICRLEWTASVIADKKAKSEKVPISRTPQTCHGPPPRQGKHILDLHISFSICLFFAAIVSRLIIYSYGPDS